MAFAPLRKHLWRENNAVLLSALDARYLPLRLLSFEKAGGKLVCSVPSGTSLGYFQGASAAPALTQGAVEQELSSVLTFNLEGELGVKALRFAQGLFKGVLSKEESSTLQFYSESVYENDLETYIFNSKPSQAWRNKRQHIVNNAALQSFAHKFACFRMPSKDVIEGETFKFGIITEVFYAVHVQVKDGSATKKRHQ
jgi:hypothetical protein